MTYASAFFDLQLEFARRVTILSTRRPPVAVILVGALLLACAGPDAAGAQVFIASQPKPEFTIGPLFVRANVGPTPGPVDLTVLSSVVAPGAARSDAGPQDIYPSEAPDPAGAGLRERPP